MIDFEIDFIRRWKRRIGSSRRLWNVAIARNGSRWATVSIGPGWYALFHAGITIRNGRDGRSGSSESACGAGGSGHAAAAAAGAGLLRLDGSDG